MNNMKFAMISSFLFAVLFVAADFVQSNLETQFRFSEKKKTHKFFNKNGISNLQNQNAADVVHAASAVLKNEQNHGAGSSTAERRPAAEDQRRINLENFLNQNSIGKWRVENPSDRQFSFLGAKSKESFITEDEVFGFASSVIAAGKFENVSIGKEHQNKKSTDYEKINEFKQQISSVEVYGSYVRIFRDNNDHKVTDIILEVNEFESLNQSMNYTAQEAEEKLFDYYSRLNRTIQNITCGGQTYYVDNRTAKLSHVCAAEFGGENPSRIEAIVDASNLQVLFQKNLTIYN